MDGNGVPIETVHGWLMLCHGYGEDHVYHPGACLLDLEDPSRVLRRPRSPLLWPEELWELHGQRAQGSILLYEPGGG